MTSQDNSEWYDRGDICTDFYELSYIRPAIVLPPDVVEIASFYEAPDVIVTLAVYKEKKEGILVTTRTLRERLRPKQSPPRFASFSCFACVKTRETLKDD